VSLNELVGPWPVLAGTVLQDLPPTASMTRSAQNCWATNPGTIPRPACSLADPYVWRVEDQFGLTRRKSGRLFFYGSCGQRAGQVRALGRDRASSHRAGRGQQCKALAL